MDRIYPRLIQQKFNRTLAAALLQSISIVHYFEQSATKQSNRVRGLRKFLFDSTNMKTSSIVLRLIYLIEL